MTTRGLLSRVAHGADVERAAHEAFGPEDRHVVDMRALAATSAGPVVLSHWSAAVLHGPPVLRGRLRAVHVTVQQASARPAAG